MSLLLAAVGLLAAADQPTVGKNAKTVPGRVLVKFRSGLDASAKGLELAQVGSSKGEIGDLGIHIVSMRSHSDEKSVAAVMKKRRNVALSQPDYVMAPEFIPDDTRFSNQWHLAKIQAVEAWDYSTGAEEVIVAILDTGVEGTHPDLAANLVPGWNFYGNNSDTSDVHGHGTATAGTAAAEMDNDLGVASVAGSCKIMPIRISDSRGYAYSSTTAAALRWASDHGARVANISFGFGSDATVLTAAGYFQNAGGVVTISAGNDGYFYSTPNDSRALIVSATDWSDALATWSSRGNFIDISAPGVSVLTTRRVADGSYAYWSGTSFSAPIVAGVAALILSIKPELTGQQVRDIIKLSADDRGTAGYDSSFGAGRVNAAAALLMAQSPTPPPTPVAPTINSQPKSTTVRSGKSAVFNVTATGSNLTYQWYRAAKGSSTFSALFAKTSATYVRSSVSLSDSGSRYICQVRDNASGLYTNSSAATLTVKKR
jgi:thermitase